MTDMRNYLAWIKQNQENNPEWKAANKWQNRNQTPTDPQEEKKEPVQTEEEIDEIPEEEE